MVDGTMDSNKRASGNGFRGSERNLGNDWWTSWNKQRELKESTSAAGIKIITIIIFFIKTQKVHISIFQEVTTTTTTKKTSLFIEAVSNHSEAEARQSQVSSCITVSNCQMLRKL
jgi:hypothetical protein